MAENTVAEVRKLMMLISDLRIKDNDRYEEHVNFMKEVVTFMEKISDNMNENWKKVQNSLAKLNLTIEDSIDTLLSGINPSGIKETSSYLKEIMETMGKSMQFMNLESVMRELRVLTGTSIPVTQIGEPGQIGGTPGGAEAISAQFGSPYGQTSSKSNEEPEIYGYVPEHMKKKKKKTKKKTSHLVKPSDLFKQ